ncbi:hypothetical protein ACHAPU_010260 [Fusarium lateritium]
MKDTSFSPWASVNRPEPARVVSDIMENAAVKASAAGILSGNPRIQAAQSEWERKSQGPAGISSLRPPGASSTGPPGASSLRPPQLKRNSPITDPPAAKRQNSENSRDNFDQMVKDEKRFTEEHIARQIAELTGASVKKSAMYQPPPRIATMHFATGAELLKKYTGQGSPSPSSTSTDSLPELIPPSAKSPDAPLPGDRILAIPMADADRLYSLYPLPEGGTISARGALIPPNYKLHDDPDLQFICPVRDCRRVFNGLKGLGGHFGAGHCSTTFNDNGDGTLSRIGSYQKSGTGGTPGIVVSRNPIPPNAPPPVDPGLSMFASSQQNRDKRAAEKRSTRSQEGPSQPAPRQSNPDVKSYLHQHLSPAQKTHRREDIRFMLTLPRRRELPETWKQVHRGSNLDLNHYACALAYITGREVTGNDQCVANTTRPSARLSQPCIGLPLNMPPSAKRSFSARDTCVGCKYWCHLQRQSNGCDWCPEPKNARASASLVISSSEEDGQEMDIVDEVEEPDTVVKGIRQRFRYFMEERERREQSSIQDSEVIPDQTTTDVVSTGQADGIELEMEDWEVAPGRMKDDSENIAFSNSYLTSGQPITVSEDVSFNVILLKPGSASHWNVEEDKLRTCSVAAGKVRVTMGEKTFQMGPNGMFVVRPGQACKVENRLYQDSVIHCTTMGDFSLQ